MYLSQDAQSARGNRVCVCVRARVYIQQPAGPKSAWGMLALCQWDLALVVAVSL